MAMEILNDRQVKALAETKASQSDGGGLTFRGKANGQAEVFFVYPRHGKKHRMYLGLYPAMTLATARKQAAKWRAIRDAGDDPVDFKERVDRDERFPARTLADVSVEFWEKEKAPTLFHGHKPNQWFNPMRLYILPALGDRKMDTITVPEMAKLINETRKHSNDQARKSLYCLRQIYRYGRGLCGQKVDRNFMEDVEDALPVKINHRGTKKTKRKAHLPVPQIAEFYQTLADDNLDELALRFLILSGLRTQNMRWLRWDEILDDLWVMDGDRMKVKDDEVFIQPLSSEMQRVLDLARAFRSNSSPYVFHNPKAFRTGVITENRINDILAERQVYGVDGSIPMRLIPKYDAKPQRFVTGHGFRSTFQGWGWKTYGVKNPLVDECMAHQVVSGTKWHYDQEPRIEERREVLEAWGEFLTTQASQNVVKLHG